MDVWKQTQKKLVPSSESQYQSRQEKSEAFLEQLDGTEDLLKILPLFQLL